jgi:hypothetical protein
MEFYWISRSFVGNIDARCTLVQFYWSNFKRKIVSSMNISSTPISIHTANILGVFTDPFEFEGDYGSDVNPIRKQVFDLVVSREALAKNLSDIEVRNLMVQEAIFEERKHGPTLLQLIPQELIDEIKKKQIELCEVGFKDSDFENMLHFIDHYKDQNVFHFLRNNPPELLNLDKTLRDQAARLGKPFDLPILGSTKILDGMNSFELKRKLIEAVFTKETLALTRTQDQIKQSLSKLTEGYLKEFLGKTANNGDLEAFSSSAGQVFFYWMYQALNLHLIAANPQRIALVNQVKEIFAHTLGDAAARAKIFKEKLMAANSGVLFTQESDGLVAKALTNDGCFLPLDLQNSRDGTLVFLRSDLWEPNYKMIPIENYDGYKLGRMNVILATRKSSGEQFLLASCHGHSTKPEDGRLQISVIMEKFYQLSDGKLQLLIGIDANTKSEEDVRLFRKHLDALGLVGTQVGPTTIKKRMVTAQHSKSGRDAVDEEDYLITLKAEKGGQLQFSCVTVGFKEGRADLDKSLPNIENPSDHYPVGALMVPK